MICENTTEIFFPQNAVGKIYPEIRRSAYTLSRRPEFLLHKRDIFSLSSLLVKHFMRKSSFKKIEENIAY